MSPASFTHAGGGIMNSRTKIGLPFITTTAALIATLAFLGTAASASTYDESVSGDLPNDPTTPHAMALSLGTNSILGTVGSGAGADSLDAIALTVPPGMTLAAFTNASYSGASAQDFIGFQPGSSFVGSIFVNSNYAGLAHFGLGATNVGVGTPPGTPTSTVGLDLLPVMNSEGLAVGASGFTIPPGPGTYTFVLGPLTPSLDEFPTYQFDVMVTPEPAGVMFACIAPIALILSRRTVRDRVQREHRGDAIIFAPA
jgi:hypothetical protein